MRMCKERELTVKLLPDPATVCKGHTGTAILTRFFDLILCELARAFQVMLLQRSEAQFWVPSRGSQVSAPEVHQATLPEAPGKKRATRSKRGLV